MKLLGGVHDIDHDFGYYLGGYTPAYFIEGWQGNERSVGLRGIFLFAIANTSDTVSLLANI